jgi:transposase
MTKKTRKNYTAEFKREAIRLVTDEGYKAAEAARSLDINANMLRRWVQQSREGDESSFPGKGNLSPEHEEIRKLREENKRLRQEKEILKKATAFFAKEGN